jgi:hypothetical protein
MKTKKKSVEYQVFVEGRGSSRPQHLEFNEHWHRLLWFACPSAAVAMFASSLYHGGELVMTWELFLVPPLFRFHEIWATCDNDDRKTKGIRGQYWKRYSKWIPRHRHPLSHSVLLGTPIRFCVGYWPIILAFTLGWNYQIVYGVSQGAIALTTGLSLMNFPLFAARFIQFWFCVCVLADVCHMILDRYNPIEWLIGQH